jgi:hypothetical protein
MWVLASGALGPAGAGAQDVGPGGSTPVAGPGGCCVTASVDDSGIGRVGYVQWSVRGRQSIWAAASPPGGPLPSGGRLLRMGPMHLTTGSPAFAWDGQGRAVVVWRGAAREANPTLRGVRVYAAAQRSDGSWTGPQPLSRAGRGARSPVVAVDRAGNAVVAWSQQTRRGWRLAAARRAAGSARFGRSRAISRSGACCLEKAVAVTGARWAIAWSERDAIRFVTGGTAAARAFAVRARGESVWDDDIDLAIGADGTVALGWRQQLRRVGRWRSMGAVIIPGASAPIAHRLAPDVDETDPDGVFRPDAGPRVAVAAAGEALFAVPRAASGGRLGIVTVSFAAPAWPQPEPLGADVGVDVRLVTADDGRVAAIWSDWADPAAAIRVAVRPPGGPFGAPFELAKDAGARWPGVGIHGDRLAAGWLTDGPVRGVTRTLP